MPRKYAFLAGLGILAGAYLLPAATVGAQENAPPPTVPCVGCGPSGTKVPGANTAYAWTDHHCLPDGTSAFSTTFGLGKNTTGPATFYARFNNGPLPDRVLATLNPGQEMQVYPLVVVPPGDTVVIDIIALRNGVAIPFGNGSNLRSFTLTCDCVQPPTTTVPSVSTPSTPPPSATGSSVPAGGSTVPPPSTPGGTPTTVPFNLPATGVDIADVAAWGAVILFVGLLLWFGTSGGRLVIRDEEGHAE